MTGVDSMESYRAALVDRITTALAVPDWHTATAVADRLVRLAPESANAWLFLATARLGIDAHAALSAAERARALDPTHVEALVCEAVALGATGQGEGLRRSLRELILVKPDHPALPGLLGGLLSSHVPREGARGTILSACHESGRVVTAIVLTDGAWMDAAIVELPTGEVRHLNRMSERPVDGGRVILAESDLPWPTAPGMLRIAVTLTDGGRLSDASVRWIGHAVPCGLWDANELVVRGWVKGPAEGAELTIAAADKAGPIGRPVPARPLRDGAAPGAPPGAQGFAILCDRPIDSDSLLLHIGAGGPDRQVSAATDLARPKLADLPMVDRGPVDPGMPRPIDVIIPVHGGRETTLACLASVAAAAVRVPARVVVIFDAGPDQLLRDAIRRLAGEGAFLLLENERNLGFVATVNRGLGLDPSRDVVILNSDTLVSDGWLDRLSAAAYREPWTATVTPLSNNATICSYPALDGSSPLPMPAECAELDRLAAEVNAGAAVALPTGVGFCMYIRRDCLDDVGVFDAATFGIGYGEETDFCLRARTRGWRNVAACDVFVGHAGGVSFGADRAALLARAAAAMECRYPGYADLIAGFVKDDSLRVFRRHLDLARARASVPAAGAELFISLNLGGGTAQFVDQARAVSRDKGRGTILLQPDPDAQGQDAILLNIDWVDRAVNLRFDLPDEAQALLEALRGLCVVHAQIHHFLGLDRRLLSLPRLLAVAYQVNVHDFSWYCPRVTLMDGSGRYCGDPTLEQCERCVAVNGHRLGVEVGVAELQRHSARLLGGAARVLVPTADTATRYSRRFPGLALTVEPHPDRTLPVPSRPRPLTGTAPLQVAVIGAIGRHKGFGLLLETAWLAAHRKEPVRFTVVGFTEDDGALLRTGVVDITGRFTEDEVDRLIRASNCTVGLLPSVVPETWCFALSQMVANGLYPVALDLGAQAERIRALGSGLLLPPLAGAAELLQALLDLRRGHPEKATPLEPPAVACYPP